MRYVGERVAAVMAETLDAARDAGPAVAVGYELPLDPVMHDGRCTPVRYDFGQSGGRHLNSDTEVGNRRSPGGVRRTHVPQPAHRQRADGAALRRARRYDPAERGYTLISGNQGVHRQKVGLLESSACRTACALICDDVGGELGRAPTVYPEQAVVVWAASGVGRPVRWTSDRSESFPADYSGP